jgi:hypothetical protein
MKREAPAPLIAGAIVIGLALVGFIGYKALAGPSYTKAPTAVELYSKADQLTLQCGGDFSKLTPDQQKLLDNMTLGHGKKYVEIHYPKLSSSGGK